MVSLSEIRGEAAESLAGTTAAFLTQFKAAIARVQEATLTRVDEAFKAAAALEKERVDKMFNSASIVFQAEPPEKFADLETKMASLDGANLKIVSAQLQQHVGHACSRDCEVE